MRISCPVCNAAYQVPDDQLSAGKLVRCARCGTDWAPVVAIPDDGERSPPPVAEPTPVMEPVAPRKMALEDVPESLEPPPPPAAPPVQRRFPWLPIAWVASVALVAAFCAAVVIGRERVMQVWPPSIRGYAAIGLAGR